MVMSTLAVKPGRGLRARPAVPCPHLAGPGGPRFSYSFYAQTQRVECDCKYSGAASRLAPEEKASRGINISYRNVNGGMDTGAWPEGAGSAVEVDPVSRSSHSGRLEGAPTARPSGPLHAISSGRCAGRRARSSANPNCNFGGIRPTARGASPSRIRPRPSTHRMAPPALRPSEQTPAHHGMPARSSARRRLPQTEPSSSSIVTSHFRLPPGGRKKRVRPRKAIGSRAAGVELHHPTGFGRRISEGAGQAFRARGCAILNRPARPGRVTIGSTAG